MTAFYSEFDPKAAAWLRELIRQGHIADGIVDERDLWDVTPADLAGFDQVHLCAGIGVWSLALRRAGVADDEPWWTASFPCQPFSAAGKGEGFADPRHLWPAGQYLIEQCRPRRIAGEQVASKDAEPWLDTVQADLEALGYAFGACAFPSAGVGAPHIRDRTYWLADASEPGRLAWGRDAGSSDGRGSARLEPGRLHDASGVEDTLHAERRAQHVDRGDGRDGADDRREEAHGLAGTRSEVRRLAFPHRDEPRQGRDSRAAVGEGLWAQSSGRRDVGGLADADSQQQRGLAGGESTTPDSAQREVGFEDRQRHGHFNDRGDAAKRSAGPVNGQWRDADWLLCRDGKWRPVEPGTFPLAHGAPARVGRLRGYGNAVNAIAAQAWIESYLEAERVANRDFRLTGIFA